MDGSSRAAPSSRHSEEPVSANHRYRGVASRGFLQTLTDHIHRTHPENAVTADNARCAQCYSAIPFAESTRHASVLWRALPGQRKETFDGGSSRAASDACRLSRSLRV